jgi:hypothetical protein
LQIEFGAGELSIASGGAELVTGTATYNVPEFEPVVEVTGAIVTLKQTGLEGLRSFAIQRPVNEWDLQLGAMPMNLDIEAGAYKASYDFGGLALTSLSISDGAAQSTVVFSAPNAAEMSNFSYETGASNVTIEQIGNASPASFAFRCGAGNYTLDFSGELQRDLNGTVEAGLGNLKLVIPEGVRAQITVDGAVSNVTAQGDWEHDGDTYTQGGEGPSIVLMVTIGAGNLELTH